MRNITLSIMICLTLLPARGIEFDHTNDSKVAAGLRLGMSTIPSLEVEIDAEYRPFRYIGANVGLLYTSSLENKTHQVGIESLEEQYVWEIHGFREACYQMAVKAGIQFTTPAIMLSKNEMGLSLRVSPGITIPFPTNKSVTVDNFQILFIEDGDQKDIELKFLSDEEHKNTGAKFWYWHARAELVIEYEDNWEFSFGYTYSNMDIYGGSRNIVIHDTPLVIGDKEPLHTINLGLTYKF